MVSILQGNRLKKSSSLISASFGAKHNSMKRKLSSGDMNTEESRKKAKIEESNFTSPIEVPEILATILKYSLPSSSSVLYLGSLTKR